MEAGGWGCTEFAPVGWVLRRRATCSPAASASGWHSPLDCASSIPKSDPKGDREASIVARNSRRGADVITSFTDPFEALLGLQRALEARRASDWLRDSTAGQGPFPPINVFQQGEDLLAIIELPGLDRSDLDVQVKENTIRVSGRKAVAYQDGASIHRRERLSGEFDRSLSLPVDIDANGIRAEYQDGLLALYLPRAERVKPRTIKIK
jgi:HSP20 family protein